MPGQVDGEVRRRGRDAELAQRAARRIGEYLTTHSGADPVAIQGELAGDDALVVPREAAVLLAQILGYLASGEGVNVMPDSAELTTQQAAEFLNVSRPYLIKLLEAEQIPYRRVGTHRRIRFRDLRAYQSKDDLERRRAADELTQLSQELGCTDAEALMRRRSPREAARIASALTAAAAGTGIAAEVAQSDL